MFGHDDKDNEDKDKTGIDSSAANDNPSGGQDWQHPGTPIDDKPALDDKPDDSPADTTTPASDDEPAASAPTVAEEPSAPAEPSVEPAEPAPAEPAEASTPAIGSADDLIDIKQDALHKLSPLIGHLDQSPEDKFRTLMMMIQASDDQSLVKQAYETAQEISDEKERAQALLDIVNEINYFTQTPAKPE